MFIIIDPEGEDSTDYARENICVVLQEVADRFQR